MGNSASSLGSQSVEQRQPRRTKGTKPPEPLQDANHNIGLKELYTSDNSIAEYDDPQTCSIEAYCVDLESFQYYFCPRPYGPSWGNMDVAWMSEVLASSNTSVKNSQFSNSYVWLRCQRNKLAIHGLGEPNWESRKELPALCFQF
jgi:hypothetical protein